MFVYLNDGRKVNICWVATFYTRGSNVVYEMAKGNNQEVIESFETEADAQARVDELYKKYGI